LIPLKLGQVRRNSTFFRNVALQPIVSSSDKSAKVSQGTNTFLSGVFGKPDAQSAREAEK
jgi:hypothetical protein